MSLIQTLPAGALDIIGGIHGEHEALVGLLRHLGYDAQGRHPQHRTLVFVGDFCDRGPNSPAVLALVQKLVESGRAVAVLGNHEINLLREEAKEGLAGSLTHALKKTMRNTPPTTAQMKRRARKLSRFCRHSLLA